MVNSASRPKQSENGNYAGTTVHSFRNTLEGVTKRALDIVVALFGLIVLSPFFIIIAILIKRDTPGPVFYWGPRIGRHGVIFKMLKFRTMYETSKSYHGPRVTSKEDERITPFGKWLRDTKLNEFPQLWNVLIGEMSLVGPRPEDPAISKTWPVNVAHEILSVRPGITSPASILYRDEESMLHVGEVMQKYLHELSPDKMRLDQLYVRYRSFWLDLDVILWTALLLVPKTKTYSPPEHFLFVGPVTRLIQRYVNWFLLDFLVVLASIGITSAVVRLFGPFNMNWLRTIQMAIASAALYTLTGLFLNTNRVNWPKASSWEIGRLWASWMVSTTIILSFHFYLGIKGLRFYGVLLGASVLSLFGIVVVRYRWRLVSGALSRVLTRRLRKHIVRERVLIVGSGRTAEHIAWLMDHPTYSGKFKIVGFIDEDLMSQGMKIYGSKVIGKVEQIHQLIKKHNIGLIILADNQMASRQYMEFRDTASFSPARIVVAPDIFGALSGLNGDSSGSLADNHSIDFACQHCLARYANHHLPAQNIRPHEIRTMPLMEQIPHSGNGKKWKISGQKRKSL